MLFLLLLFVWLLLLPSESKNRPSREVVSRSLQHSPTSLIFLLLLQLGVARTWKELFIAKGTLASQASNSEITIHAIL